MSKVSGRVRRAGLVTIMVLVAAACGSTAPPALQQQAQQAGGNELGAVAAPTLPPGAHINKKGQVVNAQGEVIGDAEDFGLSGGSSGGVDGSGDTTGATGPGGGGDLGGGGSGSSALGPGITSSKIYVGIPYQDSGSANSAAFGVPLDVDARKPYNAVIDEVNKAGGILGREIVPLYYKFDAASSEPIDQQSQDACAYWTQDNKIFFLLGADATGILQECAKKAQVSQIYVGPGFLPEDYQNYPNYIDIDGINLVRTGSVTITGLDNENYFGKAPKIGIVTWDDSDYRAQLERGFVPALKAHGQQLGTDPAYASPPQTVNDLAATSADINNAVLRFQTDGITHVMILDGPSGLCAGGCLTTLFLQRADKQKYYPRYGFNGRNGVQGLRDSGLVPDDQLKRSINVEWEDNDESADEGWHVNKTREQCYALMRKHNVPMENVNQQGFARFACEQLGMMVEGASRLGKAVLNAPNFTAAVNTIGWDFQSASSYAVHYSATQHDGTAAARNQKFVNSCNCYKFTTDPYKV